MDVLDYYEVVTSKIFKLESMNEGLVLIAPEQEVDGIRSLMVGLYVPEHERYKMYTFRSSMNEVNLETSTRRWSAQWMCLNRIGTESERKGGRGSNLLPP